MSQNTSQTQKQIRWTTVKIPVELRDKINDLAKKEEKPAWRIVQDAIAFYYAQKQKPRIKEDASLVDKISWYIAKISMSVGEFKANPSQENFERLRRTAQQIQERLGVDVSLLIRNAEAFMRSPDNDNRMELNASLKILILDIIMNKLVKE